jgi:type I restriction enzyme S subunit
VRIGWQTKKLMEVSAAVSTGPFGSILHKADYVDDGVPLVNPINIVDDRIVPDPSKLISNVTKQRLASYVLAEGDIVVARRGEIGRCAVVSPNETGWLCGTGSFFIRPLPSTDSRFLAHLLRSASYREKLEKASTGTTMRNLSNMALRDLIVDLPPLSEQQRIVGILDEAFVCIATAKANAEQNLQNARALFDGYLEAVFTQRGPGWVETRLGEAYDVRDGTHDSPKYHAIGYPLITSKNLKREGLSFDDVKLITEQDYEKINERSVVHKGDVLFAMIGTIGNPTLVTVEPNFAIKNVALFKIPSGQSGAFLKHYLDSSWVISKMISEAKGTTQKFVGLGYLRSFPINVPPLPTQLEVVEKLDELSEETQHLESIYHQKLDALEALKKSLLHQVFTGAL